MVDYVAIHYLEFPLVTPYKLSSGALHLFDPIVIEVRDADGRTGWGEALIAPGYTPETIEGAWKLGCELAERIVGLDAQTAARVITQQLHVSPGAASALLAALDMLSGHPILSITGDTTVPLLAPCQAHERAQIADEVEHLLEQGFRTLKVKVGYRWQDDLERLQCIQQAVAGRATLRLDANRAFSAADGKSFAARLDPQGIELFEQPCGADDWDANAAVAAVSTVPVMLDESIYGVDDIDRAARIPGVGFVKLKLKKIGSLAMLESALARIRALGLTPVLGDGVAIEIGCWMEACVARRTITNAGEMNGFLKVRQRLFTNPLPFNDGVITLPAGYWPHIDRRVLAAHTREARQFSARPVVAG